MDWKSGREVVHYIGFCADEVKRFKDNSDIYPLAELNIYESEVLEYAKQCDIFDGWYKSFTRLGCKFCPCGTYKEYAWEYLYNRKEFEERFEKIRNYEKNIIQHTFNLILNITPIMYIIL